LQSILEDTKTKYSFSTGINAERWGLWQGGL